MKSYWSSDLLWISYQFQLLNCLCLLLIFTHDSPKLKPTWSNDLNRRFCTLASKRNGLMGQRQWPLSKLSTLSDEISFTLPWIVISNLVTVNFQIHHPHVWSSSINPNYSFVFKSPVSLWIPVHSIWRMNYNLQFLCEFQSSVFQYLCEF